MGLCMGTDMHYLWHLAGAVEWKPSKIMLYYGDGYGSGHGQGYGHGYGNCDGNCDGYGYGYKY